MSGPLPSSRLYRALLCVSFLTCATPALAQRTLHWDAIEVEATLDASGRLRVDEAQTLVFTGEWNGGERVFDIRPRQQVDFIGIYRDDGGTWRELREDSSLDDVDEYAWVDRTLRWRSREATDPPFAQTSIRYLIRYELSNILLKDGESYTLDHDFLFADREDVIRRFDLRLTLDDAWQAGQGVREAYSARNIAPGNGFVVTIPMSYIGTGTPVALDTSRPFDVQLTVSTLLGATFLTVLWVFFREWTRGRFAPLERHLDERWLQEHVLRHPAEVVGAAWDEQIGSPEVVALIARMVREGKLKSEVGKRGAMTLHLEVDRDTLQGHERTLVDRLFFNKRVTTNTQLVKQHYRQRGFNPALEITPELQTAVAAAVPEGQRPRPWRYATRILMLTGIVLLIIEWSSGRLHTGLLVGLVIGTFVLAGVAIAIGSAFRANIHWQQGAALLCLLAAIIPALLAAFVLWRYVGLGFIEGSRVFMWGVTLLALAVVGACANAMVSRQYPAGIAFRKRIGAARRYFMTELRREQPALRDEWFPWLLALGLGPRMDDWSARQPSSASRSVSSSATAWTSGSASASSAGSGSWTGFAGGRSGGGGGGAAWTTAASGLAAGVSPPSSSGSSSGGSSSSSSSSSSGGSSGGGGGGGW
jgi:hypothetical protein